MEKTLQRPDYAWLKSYPKEVDWFADLGSKPVPSLLDDSVARFGARPFLDFMDKKYTYAEVGALVDRAAKGFQQIGVTKGTKVGLCLPNTPYYIICFFAILKAGGTVVNFNPLYAERELKHQIEDSETDIMVTLDLKVTYDKQARMLRESRLKRIVVCKMAGILPFPKSLLFPLVKRKEIADIPVDERHVPFATLVANDGRFNPVAIDPAEDLAVLQYTGGTTGVPKGAMLTHANVYSNAVQCRSWFIGAAPGQERMMGVLPFFHVFALTVVMTTSIVLGAEIVMLPRFELDKTLDAIQKKKVTLFPAVPTIYTAINNHKDRGKYDLTSLKICFSGGAPLPVEVSEQFQQSTGCRLVEGYGLSETSPVTHGGPLDGRTIPGSIGLPFPRTEVKIISLEDRKTEMPVGERGEVCIRGPQVMKGYWNKPEETAQVMDGDLFHTGDVGYMDENGFFYIVDRIKDMINAGGYKIYPRNVEEALYLHPHVEEVIVAGVPDQYRGETVKAYIKLVKGTTATPEELSAFLQDKLSTIEVPKLYEFRDELPKTMIGKLSRKAVLEEEAARSAAASQKVSGAA